MNTVALVVSLRRNNPKWSLRDIGNRCGITKQRVYAILKKYNEKTAGIHRVTVNCAVCSKPISRIDAEVNRNGVNFCGRKCQGKYLGTGKYKKETI